MPRESIPRPKPYKSEKWLRLQHYTRGKSIDEIAKECNVAPMTIRREFQRFGIRIAK